MPSVKEVEKYIWDVERFYVQFRGKLKQEIPQYNKKIAANKDWTVADWKERLLTLYPDFDIVVFNGDGKKIVAGMTLLRTVRGTYSEEQG